MDAVHPEQPDAAAVVVIFPPTENAHADASRRTRVPPQCGQGSVSVPDRTSSSKSFEQSSHLNS